MGLDVGDKRIGVALSDEGAIIATPRQTLERRGNRKDIAHLLELARSEDVVEILVGMPLSLDGSEGPQAKKIGRFIEALRAATELTVTTWDERFTTVSASAPLSRPTCRARNANRRSTKSLRRSSSKAIWIRGAGRTPDMRVLKPLVILLLIATAAASTVAYRAYDAAQTPY